MCNSQLMSTAFSLFIFKDYVQAGCDFLKMIPSLLDLRQCTELNGKTFINKDIMIGLALGIGPQKNLCN